MIAKVFVAAVLVVAASGIALAASPDAAGTATMTTRQTPDSGAGTSKNPPASSVGGGIIGSDAVHGKGDHEASGLSPQPSRPSPEKQ